MVDEMKIRLHLSNGQTFVAEAQEDEYSYIYDRWVEGGRKSILFDNGEFLAEDIIGLEYMK